MIDDMHTNPEKAEHLLTLLSDLLRMMLQNIRRDEITIQEDVEFMKLYFQILGIRLGTEFDYRTRISEECRDGKIPPGSTIIPLIEEIFEQAKHPLQEANTVVYEANLHEKEQKDTDQVELRLFLKGVYLSDQQLEVCYKKAGIGQVLETVKNRYEKKYPFNMYSASDGIYMELCLPLIADESIQNWRSRQDANRAEGRWQNELD